MTDNIILPLELPEGFSVETVYYGSGTLCISSQAGCRMACPFCASGRAGLKRNLTAEEMHKQVALHKDNDVKRITISGIGEPLENLDAVLQFMSETNLSVSVTTSVPDRSKLEQLLKSEHNGVMLSIHAGTVETHKKLIPKAENLDDIFITLSKVWSELSVNKRKKIGFNYMLLSEINDSEKELCTFTDRIAEFKEATVHLLVCNDVENSRYESPDTCRFTCVYERMREKGINVRRANSWRKSSTGGCGTLFLQTL